MSFRASVARLRAYVVREFASWLGGSSTSAVCELLVILRGPDVHELWTDVHCNKKKILILTKKIICCCSSLSQRCHTGNHCGMALKKAFRIG